MQDRVVVTGDTAEKDNMPNVQLMDLPGTALQQLLLSVPAPIAFMLATTCRRFHEELKHNRKVLCVVFACLLYWCGTSDACQLCACQHDRQFCTK